jgi:hypothetical protein
MHYAIMLDDVTVSIVKAGSLVEAVERKHTIQAKYNEYHGCDAVFHVRRVSGAAYRRFCSDVETFTSEDGRLLVCALLPRDGW